MISGMFVLNPNKKFDTKRFYKKNVLRLFTALCFWSIAYGLYGVCSNPNSSWTLFSIIGPVFYKRLPWYHLWFMYMIIGLYVLVPLLRVFIKNASRRNLEYFVVLFFVANSIAFWNEFMPKLNFSLPEVTSYLGYFILGYYLLNYEFSKRTRNLIYILSLFSVAFIVLLHLKMDAPPRTYISATNNPFVIIIASGAFLLFKYSNLKEGKCYGVIKELSKLSFGVYLVHDFFIQFIQLDFLPGSAWVVIPIKGILVILCSLVVIFVLSKIPVVKKYLI